MRIRTGLCLLVCCYAGLTACTAGPHKGPDTTVTTPHVGRPQAPLLRPGGAVPRRVHPLRRAQPVQ
jgi:hypothetical protein